MKDREYWDRILHDTWSHNPYLEIMEEILYKKYPVEVHEDHSDLWADPVVKTESKMRELIEKMEYYWKAHVHELYDELYATNQEIIRVIAYITGNTDQLE